MINKAFLIAGTNSGVGKTTITLGILRALRNRGVKIASFKTGPDYIDPVFHEFASGTDCYNLDLNLVGENNTKFLFSRNSAEKEIAVVEGVMGLYDGMNFELDNGSSAHLSKVLKIPTILVIDASGMAASVLAHIKGYMDYDKDLNIKGVILNKVSSSQLYEYLKEPIEEKLGIKVFGYLKREDYISLSSRHLGLIPAHEVDELDLKLEKIASLIEETIDIDELLNEFAYNQKVEFESPDIESLKKIGKGLRIAIAKDKAFNFYYKDNIKLLEDIGVELVEFSPISDEVLPPDLDGVYIGGGFPEVFMSELTSNTSMIEDIRVKLSSGLPCYAECGGFMYLTQSITDLSDSKHKMVGFYNCDSVMTKRLQRFGYVDVDYEGVSTMGHEFHRSKMINDDSDDYQYKITKSSNKTITWRCGMKKGNTLAAYAHIHFYSNLKFLEKILEDFAK